LELATDIWVWVAAILTLFVYSFLIKDNPLYKFAEHAMGGLGVGYWTAVLFYNVIIPDFWEPLTIAIRKLSMTPQNFDAFMAREGFSQMPQIMQDFSPGVSILLLLLPAIIGLLLFTRYIPKIAWISRFSLAFYLGAASGIAIPNTFQTRILEQLRGTIVQDAPDGSVAPLFSFDAWRDFFAAPGIETFFDAISGPLLILGVICTLSYFFFSKEHKGILGGMARIGIWFLMIGFGASFGYTVMGRVSLLIGRVQFLLTDWLGVAG
jgi:hypothetical protein